MNIINVLHEPPTDHKEGTREKALIFRCEHDRTTTRLLHVSGVALAQEWSDLGSDMDDYDPVAFCPLEPGLWLWEGTVTWIGGRSYMGYDVDDPEPRYDGVYRRLTYEEAAHVAMGDFAFMEKETDKEWPGRD